MLIAAIIAVFIGWSSAVWYASGQYHDAEHTQAQAAKDVEIAELKQNAAVEGAKGIAEKDAAYQKGKAEGKIVVQTITARGAADVAKYPVFSNPDCVLPPATLAYLNAARGSMRTNKPPPEVAVSTPVVPEQPKNVPAPKSASSSERATGHPKPVPKATTK